MDEEKLLKSSTSWQKKNYKPNTLGTSVKNYLDKRKRNFKRNSAIVEAFYEVLPQRFKDKCSLKEITGSNLKVAVKPGPWMHLLNTEADFILKNLRRKCPSAKINKIRLYPADLNTE
jgi:hypothetical protein